MHSIVQAGAAMQVDRGATFMVAFLSSKNLGYKFVDHKIGLPTNALKASD